MSISNSLANALSGMSAASRMAEIVSANIANAMTPGYGRRMLELDAATIGGQGAGVSVGDVIRMVDRGLIGDRRLADAAVGKGTTTTDFLGRLEKIFGTAGGEGGLDSAFQKLEQSLLNASSDPSSAISLGGVRDGFAGAIDAINSAARSVQDLRADADAEIARQVEALNAGLQNVQRLNADITRSLNGGQDAAGLMDQRQKVIDEIAAIVPIRELDRSGGQVALMTPSGEMLLDGTAKTYDFTSNPVVTEDMTLQSGALLGIERDGEALGPDGVGRLAGGSLSALFEARDVTLVQAQSDLDQLAADFVQRFQSGAVDPSLGPGDAGLVTDNGAPFDALNIDGLAGRLALNDRVDPAQGGELYRLRDGINAAAPGPSGNSDQFLRLSQALSDPGPVSGSAMNVAVSELQTNNALARKTAEDQLGFDTARWTSLSAAEAATGVDTDYELQMLLRIEQSYAANARLIQTIDSMMSRLMEL